MKTNNQERQQSPKCQYPGCRQQARESFTYIQGQSKVFCTKHIAIVRRNVESRTIWYD